ncbi:hypothetical protein RB195_002922 [Necator americanus]|uniref:Degenerin mec-4/10 cytosolic domain-containing protein n=1 Tax=Necator americanus TaxID=51031 RepID=A0ABR1DL98_NECAM
MDFTERADLSIFSNRFVPSPLSSKMSSSFMSDLDEGLEPYSAELAAGRPLQRTHQPFPNKKCIDEHRLVDGQPYSHEFAADRLATVNMDQNKNYRTQKVVDIRGPPPPFAPYLASDTNILKAAEIMTTYVYGESSNDNEKEIQCDLLTEDGGHEIDPTRLSYKERIRWHLKEFCYKTSSHGIPMLGQAPNLIYRIVWIILLSGCAFMFIYQAIAVVDKYSRMDKITDIQLKFDTAPFPAITLCNLNPYRDSKIRDEASINKILSVFKKMMNKAAGASELGELENVVDDLKVTLKYDRRKRNVESKGMFEPANSVCYCEEEECEADAPKHPTPTDQLCICAFDRLTHDAWPCHPREQWLNTTCQHCDDHRFCQKRSKTGVRKNEPCLCEKGESFCMLYDRIAKILNLWEFFGSSHDYNAEVSEDETEALGFGNMTDEVAIVTKAKENIIFAMSALSEEQRRAMSQAKHNLIHKCSFNGKPCDIDKDFAIISDPTFGNCFTFNHNRSDFKSSLRAGPMYGLRVMLFVNASDYLPTSEAVGVRLTIHDKDEFPFPDTFGYSAPTGYISSFGMRMKKMSRLPAPYGDCVAQGATSNYVYKGYTYSTEGCYRTCFQQLIIDRCGCGDPRFPSIGEHQHCQVFNKQHRACLEQSTHELGDIHGSFKCRCQQPCNQTIYTMSYSEAIWPSQSLNITLGTCEEEPEICNEQYQENAAMLEVFYEALNFETLTESEAYGVVKMLADFGGQLGLWSGVSFMTCCEFVCLGCEILYMIIMHHWKKYKLKKHEESNEF